MRAVSLVVVILATLIIVGEPAVSAMNAPTVLPHSVAHVMGYMCRTGRGGEPNRQEAVDGSTGGKWRIKNGQGTLFSQDATIGILEYLNKTDCEAAVKTLNRQFVLRGQKVQYVCVWSKD